MATTSSAPVQLRDRDYLMKIVGRNASDKADVLNPLTGLEAKALSDVALVTKTELVGEAWQGGRNYLCKWLVGHFPIFDELAIRILDRKRKGLSPHIIKGQECPTFKQAIRLILDCDPSYYFKLRKKYLGGGWQKALPAEATAPDKAEVAETSVTDIKVDEPDAKDPEVCDPDPVPMPSDETVDKVHSAANETATEINVPESEVCDPAQLPVRPREEIIATTVKGRFWRNTIRGFDFLKVASALQKAIRRGNAPMACYWAAELYNSPRFKHYVWNRLLVISAEDCWGTITQHVEALRQEVKALESADKLVNKGKDDSKATVLFVLKAAYLLATASKNRDVDNFYCLVYQPAAIPEKELLDDLEASKDLKEPIPSEALDMHTPEGEKLLRARGWSKKQMKEQFILKETKALKPYHQTEFHHLVDGIADFESR